MDRKVYWCPKCGRMFTGAIAFRKHVDSKKCKLNREKDEKEKREKMKGRILFTDGREEYIEPKNGTDFSLEELRTIVGGYIEIVYLDDGRIMIVNEEGKIHRLPVNVKATFIVNGIGKQDLIVGNVLVCRSEMVK